MASLDYAYRRLVNTLGPERVGRGELERMVYSHDFAALPKPALLQWRLCPDFVVLPQTTEEVSQIVRLSDETGLMITPRGGGTGFYGGAVPNRGGVLVDLRKMNSVLALDPQARTVAVEAGITWRELAEQVEAKGFALPMEPTGALASTVGGAINSGGVGFGSYRGGSLRDAVLDLEVVLPDGAVIHTGPGPAGGAFADLKAFFFGAEGTLGIVTKAVLRIDPKPEETRTVAYAFEELEAGVRFLASVAEVDLGLHHAALLDKDHFTFEAALRGTAPDRTNVAVLTFRGAKDEVGDAEKAADALAQKAAGTKLAPEVGAELWAGRFTMYGARRMSKGLVVTNNLVPVARLEEAVAAARRLIRKLKLNGAVHAYLASPTTAVLAPYVLMDATRPSGGTALGFVKKCGDAVLAMDGHPMGLGLLMVFNFPKMHGRATTSMIAVKGVFDPKRKVNAGKTIEVWTKYTVPGLRAIPPRAMAVGLDVAAFFRRIKPFPDRFVKAYERGRT